MEKNNLIERFKVEVLDCGPDSTLPSNLTDEWLDLLIDQAGGDEDSRMTELFAAIIHILFAKNGYQEVAIEEKKLFDYFEQCKIELAIEEVSRRTEIKGKAATLETIFTNRNIEFSQ